MRDRRIYHSLSKMTISCPKSHVDIRRTLWMRQYSVMSAARNTESQRYQLYRTVAPEIVVDAYISLTVLARSLSSFLPLQTCLNSIFHSSHNTLFIPGESILGYQPVYENGSKLTLFQLQKCSGKRYYGLLAEERLREYQIST